MLTAQHAQDYISAILLSKPGSPVKLISQAALVVAVIATFAGGLFLIVRDSSSGRRIEVILPTATPEPRSELKVYLSGAVRSPGVYEMKPGDRLAEVVEAAGGPAEDADMTVVNLATRVSDEDHWHIPRQGEQMRTPVEAASASASPSESRKIDINSATLNELISLDGIGEVLGKRIIDYRESNGGFIAVDDLLKVEGIGPTILNKNRDLLEARAIGP